MTLALSGFLWTNGDLQAAAQTSTASEEGRHPKIGSIRSNVITNSDILALPSRERDAWIHGAVTLTAQTFASIDRTGARCIMDWYFADGNNHAVVLKSMREYPESRAAGTIYGVVTWACSID